MSDRRIWVGCLHCYNDGRLIGEWFDVDTTDESDVNLTTVHSNGKLTSSCEELWVVDYEGFEGLIKGEGNVSTFYEAHAFVEGLPEWIDRDAVFAYMDDQHMSPSKFDLGDFEEAYQGEYKNDEEFAEELVEQIYDLDDALPDLLRYRIDWEGVARDLLCSDYSSVEFDDHHYYFRY